RFDRYPRRIRPRTSTALQLVLPLGAAVPDARATPPAPRFGGAGWLEWRGSYRRQWLPARSDQPSLPQSCWLLVPLAENDNLGRYEHAGDQRRPLHDAQELGRPHRNAGLPPERGRPADPGRGRELFVEHSPRGVSK